MTCRICTPRHSDIDNGRSSLCREHSLELREGVGLGLTAKEKLELKFFRDRRGRN